MSDTREGLTLPFPALTPLGVYVSGDDHLRVTSLNSMASTVLQVSGRQVLLDGRPQPIAHRHVCTADRTVTTTTVKLAEGWITDVTVIAAEAAPRFGQTFVRVDLVRGDGTGQTVLATLVQGLVTAAQRVAYPLSPIVNTHQAPGAIRLVVGTDPGAGAEISETVPTGARWRLLAMRATLVTDATVANRFPILNFDDGATIFASADAPAAQAASLTWNWTTGGAVQRAAATVSTPAWAVPTPPILLPGYRIRTTTSALVAGDNWGAPQLLVEEWLEGV
jgi:hypothetical protein